MTMALRRLAARAGALALGWALLVAVATLIGRAGVNTRPLAYIAQDANALQSVRYLDVPRNLDVLLLPPTGAFRVKAAWSPDGGTLALIESRGVDEALVLLVPGQPPRVRATGRFSVVGGLAWTPDGAWVTFPARLDPSAELDVISVSVATGYVRRHTLGPVVNVHPSWAPDGTLAFAEAGSIARPRVVTLADLEGRAARQPIADGEWPAWSPDGAWLAFTADGANGGMGLWRRGDAAARVLSSILVGVGAPGSVAAPAWTPDSHQVVYETRGANGDRTLALVTVTDERVLPLTEGTGLGFASSPTISSDGRWLVFVANTGPGSIDDLYLLDLHHPQRAPRRLTRSVSRAGGPAWRP